MSVGGPRSREAILHGPIQGTLFRLAWPAIATALLGELQTLISTFWIGRLLGETGLAALGVISPVFTTLGLIAGAIHVGVQSLAARATGGGEGKALPIVVNGSYLGLVWGLAVTTIGLIALTPISRLLAGDLDIADLLRPYLFVWLLFYALPVICGVTVFAVNATGWTRFGMIQSILSIALLFVVMPIFLGALKLGLVGVALSDGVSDVVLLTLTCLALYRFRNDLGLGSWTRAAWRIDFGLWREILHVGLFFQVARGMDFVAQIALVRVIMLAGKTAVAGYGLAMLLITLTTSAIGCIGGAAGIMIGQNVGAGNADRAKLVLRAALVRVVALGGIAIVLASFPELLLRVFTDEDRVVAAGSDIISGLRWAMPAALASACLLRAYTAVSPNKLGNLVSIACATLTIVIANVWPGTPLESLIVAVIVSQYVRLALLAALYRRLFVR